MQENTGKLLPEEERDFQAWQEYEKKNALAEIMRPNPIAAQERIAWGHWPRRDIHHN